MKEKKALSVVDERRQIGDLPYAVTRSGEIISLRTGEMLKGSLSSGYRMATLSVKGEIVAIRYHAAVMRWFVGPRPLGHVINHKNGIKTDNRLENLEYCTPQENRDHARVNRLYKSGSRCSWSKLTEEAATVIRAAHAVGLSQKRLAKAFGVDRKAIRQVLSGKTWNYPAQPREARGAK